MDKKKTGNLIKEARIRKNYTQSELGNLIGVSNKAVSKWENGESFPDVGVLENLASVLDIRIQDIITGETGVADDRIVTEVVRVARLQQREKKQELFRNIMVIVAVLCCFMSGISAFGKKIIFDSLTAYVVLMVITLVMILVIYARQKIYTESDTGRFIKCSKLIAMISLVYSILLMWTINIMMVKGYYLFHMEMSSIGPFVNYQLAVLMILNLILIIIQLYRLNKHGESIHWGWFISVSSIFTACIYGDLLHRMSSVQDVIRSLVARTITVIVVMVIFLGIVSVIKQIANHNRDEESRMDKS